MSVFSSSLYLKLQGRTTSKHEALIHFRTSMLLTQVLEQPAMLPQVSHDGVHELPEVLFRLARYTGFF